jgi:hypothetical protein
MTAHRSKVWIDEDRKKFQAGEVGEDHVMTLADAKPR